MKSASGVAPKCERLFEAPLGREALETVEVELAHVDSQRVPGRPALDALLPERLPQLRDENLEALVCSRRRLLLPDRLDQPVARDDSVRLQQEHRQEDALLLSAQIERPRRRQTAPPQTAREELNGW